MLKRLSLITAVIGSLALLPVTASAEPVRGCQILIQFYNEGTPGIPGVVGDGRYGVRLNVADVGYVLLPASSAGYVTFYATPDTVVPFKYVRLYFDPLAEDSGTDAEAGCGFTAIQVAAGN